MKNTILLTLAALCLNTAPMAAQTVNVPFSTQAAGKSMPINWGMDTAGEWDNNVLRGVAHYGKIFTTGRISFQPVDIVSEDDIDNASKNFGLSARQVARLDHRIARIKETGTTSVTINCDNEVLSVQVGEDGFCNGTEDFTGRNNYMSGSSSANTATRWKNLIKATVKYVQSKGLTVLTVAPFNEPDNGTWQYYNAGASNTSETNQSRYGMRDFLAIAKAIKEDEFFKTGAGKDVRVSGGNTLNCDRALPWYNSCKDYLDEGNTHQLAGEFDTYAGFFEQVRKDNKVATADELHNVMEAMVGVQYGMQNGIWWMFDSKARGQFMHDSNEGVRLAYAEDRTHWTAASVYRNDKDNQIHGFIGSSERQANVSTYNFQCQDREVYFNGYGPQKEWSVTTVGGAANSYQNGQINYEYLFDITYGEDVQSAPINDGNYQLMNASNGMLATYMGENSDIACKTQANNNTQQWHIYADNVRNSGDISYWFIDNVGVSTQHFNLRNGVLTPGAKVMTYNANHDAFEQWYLRYAKDGYFYIISRRSNGYMYSNGESISLQAAPTSKTGDNELKKYLWRLMPTDATAEQTAPATPAGLAEGAVTASSASISWSAVTGESKAVTYNVLRQDANGWNTIARCQSETSFTDAKVEAGKGYRYKVQAVDYSGNRSEASETITIIVPGSENTSDYTAGKWQWKGETSAAGSWYLYNVGKANFLSMQSDHKPYINTNTASATLFTTTNANSSSFKYSDGKDYYLYHSAGTVSESTTALTWTISSYNTGYQLKTSAREGWSTVTRGLVGNDVGNTCSVSKTTSDYNSTNGTWLFISPTQMTKYGKMSTYTAAFNAAAGYLSQNISDDLKTRLESTLDACDGTINKDTDIDNYISQLDNIAEECQTYLDNNPVSGPEDFTALIVNPTIIQNGTTTDAPTGWKGATTNVTGNGHWTEGTGDTRLEAWNWSTNANGLNIDYYQDVIVPNGLYTLTAVTHQRANGDAALYAETYELLETSTTMPVGDGNEAETSVQSILVTDGSLRIGIKATNNYTGDNQWVTADNFTLTRVSTPENTALSHYTDAIAKLDELADKELVRNTDHTELLAARKAAHYCEADATAYEKAINDYAAAIKRAQAMTDAEPVLSGSWIGQTGNYGDAAERYNWDTPYPAGRILYQVVEDLIPGGEYEIQFYAVANVARNLDAGLYSGSGIAYLFANSTEQDIDVIYQDGCTPTNYLRTLRAVADENGQIAYGIANRKAGGQWYVAQSKSITYLGKPYTATLSVKSGKYGTFVAPFDVTLPDGITAYSAEQEESLVKLTQIADAGETLEAYKPVILKNSTEATINETYSRDNVTLTKAKVVDGSLAGVLIAGDDVPVGDYVLQTQNEVQAFYIVAKEHPFACTQNRCYLTTTSEDSSAAKVFHIGFGEETAIDFVVNDNAVPTAVYDLSGRKVADKARSKGLKRGLYIVGGKKVMVQ